MSKNQIINILRDLGLILFGSFLAAYFSIYFFGKDFEKTKVELAIEQTIIEKKMDVALNLIEKTSRLYQLSIMYRKYEIIGNEYIKAMIKRLKKNEKKNVSEIEIREAQMNFQISLFSSKPFISNEVFEKLSKFGMKLSQFNFSENNDSETLKEIYEEAGKNYNEALELIKAKYNTTLVKRDS
ncbi:hypothetical protein [Psychrosphaera saromensis]|uniref:Uncharacterized protein n=1 Tax=Psychrosphaera saromensis TaxID=716813 RepID=A0A2S7UT76_9GAMM|nr:hypothetical protein [Psychrosphaera saromensis]PQJ53147.1 hypothetical protein BTO11_05365 [Psychrosphaera saromensis]